MGSMLTYRDHIFVAGGMCPSPLDLTGNIHFGWSGGCLLLCHVSKHVPVLLSWLFCPFLSSQSSRVLCVCLPRCWMGKGWVLT